MRTLVYIITILLGTCLIIAPLSIDWLLVMDQMSRHGEPGPYLSIHQYPGLGFYRFGCWFTGTGMIVAGLLGATLHSVRKEKPKV